MSFWLISTQRKEEEEEEETEEKVILLVLLETISKVIRTAFIIHLYFHCFNLSKDSMEF